MAVIGINPARREPERQERPKAQPMDTLLKALSIANTGMGIAVNFQKFRDHDANLKLAEREQTRKEQQTQGETAANLLEQGRKEREFQEDVRQFGVTETREAASAKQAKLQSTREMQDRILTRFSESKPVATAKQTFNTLDKIDGFIAEGRKTGNSRATITAINQTMRGVGGEVGVATDKDFNRFAESKEIRTALADKFNLWTQGKLSEASFEEIEAITAVARQKAAEVLENEGGLATRRAGILFGSDEAATGFIRPHEEVGLSEEEFQNVLKSGKRELGPEMPVSAGGPVTASEAEQRKIAAGRAPTAAQFKQATTGKTLEQENVDKFNRREAGFPEAFRITDDRIQAVMQAHGMKNRQEAINHLQVIRQQQMGALNGRR